MALRGLIEKCYFSKTSLTQVIHDILHHAGEHGLTLLRVPERLELIKCEAVVLRRLVCLRPLELVPDQPLFVWKICTNLFLKIN